MEMIYNFGRLMLREWKMFRSNSVAVAIFIGAPIAYGLLFGFVYKQAKVTDLPITVLDYDNTPLSHKAIEMLEDNSYLEVVAFRENEHEKIKDLSSNDIVATVTIPKGFEADVMQKRYPEIQVDIDGANVVTANYANMGILTSLGTLKAGVEITALNKQGVPINTALEQYEPFKINTDRLYNGNSNYLTFMWPGIMGTIMQQVFLIVMALTFAKEFEEDSFDALAKQANHNPLMLLTVKSMPYWLLGVLLWGVLQWQFFPMFNMPTIAHEGALFLLVCVFMLSLTSIGTLFSWIFPSQLKATEFLMVIATPSFILSGFSWPLSEMPLAIQYVANCIPLTHFLTGFRKVLFYGARIDQITMEVTNLMIIGLVSGLLCLLLVSLKTKRMMKQENS
ncbi:ABC transporter permease [Sediminitomix flava]|uniref:ABC-2 type transport system permease protein n=1 Tax=Sediminitomix flava TaxID=379075 RepID=A0A315ZE38_SEDFL|nr:ABC transporter permease [Sediminitomix flava]PWJ43088.1 ABC-2 type transport system permease protein [Sediminitomix flava]